MFRKASADFGAGLYWRVFLTLAANLMDDSADA
jgi:hypothetical protein